MKGKFLIPILAVLCALISSLGMCQDVERILSYRSSILVRQDATMTVVETIKVLATGDKIKHGIYRDFPTRYTDTHGNPIVVGFTVTKVTRDGSPEPFSVKDQTNGKRVYIGDPNTLVEPGNHTYTITYDASRLLGFFKDHDELYWNVTGNGWIFPIDRVAAIVTLPKQLPASDLKLDGFTGPQGSKAKDFESYVDSTGHAIFVTTKPLGSNEGLTIIVGWPKGIVAQPTQAQKTTWFLRDNLNGILGIFGLILVIGYYILAWSKVGRDPAKGTIIPLYEPPDGMSPAALRFICRMGYDNKGFAAALIDMGVKRYIQITEEKKVYTISQYKGDASTLTPEEDALAGKLLDNGGSIELKDKNYTTIQAAIKAMSESLDKAYGAGYFSRNGVYVAPGILVSILTLAAAILTTPRDIVGSIMGVIWIVILLGTILLLLFATNYLFAVLLRAPTRKGRELLDKIEGFKLYMSVAEKDELNTMNPPEKTPEVFEKYLPYALALDVEQKWAEKFAAVLAAAAAAGTYEPDWYSGRAFANGFTAGALTSFTSNIGSSLSGAISSSSTAPGSSSGFSSGSSGGGGGGGGGGGW